MVSRQRPIGETGGRKKDEKKECLIFEVKMATWSIDCYNKRLRTM